MNNNDIPTSALIRAAQRQGGSRLNGFGDFEEPFISGVRPAIYPKPSGPADFPVNPAAGPASEAELLNRILSELIKQNIASRPVIRAAAVTSAGSTLDWSMVGMMDRLMIRNEGPNSVWMTFDRNGPSVTASTSDETWELQSQESINPSHCLFNKIGLKCAAGTATVHAMAFQSVAGNQAAAIS